MSREYDAGNGYIDGRPMYWDTNDDGSTNIFPGGLPRDKHQNMPHDHLIVNQDGGVEFMRENGQVINNYDYGRNA